MIKEGYKSKAKYWGSYTVKKIAKLEAPIPCHSQEKGEVGFIPTIIQIQWDNPPSSDNNEFWFPYWIVDGDKEKDGQFAPMIGKGALLALLKEAIRLDFFDKKFL